MLEVCQGPCVTESRPTCVLVVTGSVAAYKAPFVVRELLRRGVRVVPLVTRSATEFVGRATLAGLTGEAVPEDMFAAPGELHVELAQRADVVAVVPATADFIARLAAGRADDLATATCLCARCPVIVAPAMHPSMWEHPATRRNVAALLSDGLVELVGPVFGEVASGDEGTGRLAEPADIAGAILRKLSKRDLVGTSIVVSAGPTVEDLDPVRFISNRSTGKMGFAIARRAAERGAQTTLVAGPVALSTPAGVRRIDVRGALDMRRALLDALGERLDASDALVMCAAVGDFRPKDPSPAKIKRAGRPTSIDLVENPDILAEIGAARQAQGRARPVLVGFAVETVDEGALVAAGRKKLADKQVDLVVANRGADAFGRDDSRAALVTKGDATFVGPMPKLDLADVVLDHTRDLLQR
jgi:phosphopantothenoylcysteine decarboxylase/phosphopantothenate--cysteine ligase